ncbi:hypothetical protein ACFLZH_06020 [Patescibacteria group bacterium]
MADTRLDELKPKSITNLTIQEAEDLAFTFSHDLRSKVYDEMDASDDDPVKVDSLDPEKYPFHADFVGTFTKMISEFLSNEEIQILLRMKIKVASNCHDTLNDLFETIQEDITSVGGSSWDFEPVFLKDLHALLVELHKQRTQYAESQQNVKFDELAEQVSSLRELVEQLQARVEQVVPKE